MASGYTLYLLHFDPPYRHARHYLGVTRNGRSVALRWLEHCRGRGAVLTHNARLAGCRFILTRIWPNAEFASERRLKGRSLVPLCPLCHRLKHQNGGMR